MACRKVPPIELRLGRVTAFEPPDKGLYVTCTASEGLARLRAVVLRPPFAGAGPAFRPHVTVLHPRSVEASEADWLSYVGREIGAVVTVSDVAVVEFRDERWQTRETVSLAG